MGRNLEVMRKAAAEYKAAVVEGQVLLLAELVTRATSAVPVATGELRSSAVVSKNGTVASRRKRGRVGRLPTRSLIEIDLRALRPKLGDTLSASWIAKHANIIEGGRRRDRNGRMIGSTQARRGFVGIQLKRIRSYRLRIPKIRRVP